MTCAFDFKNEECIIIKGNKKKNCIKCKSKCNTIQDLNERYKLLIWSSQEKEELKKEKEKCMINLLDQHERNR